MEERGTKWRSVSLGAVLALYAGCCIVGVTWGLPSRHIEKYVFPDGDVWSGEKIHRLINAAGKFDPTRGADVDADPLRKGSDQPIALTATDEDVAKILVRYRLYTYQPDEMITMMALAGMKPSELNFDPRLYQYGGLFIYPVGGLIKLCGMLGLIDVRSDVVYYLDHPDEFGKFYVVARLYSAAWGLLGVLVVYVMTKRIASPRPESANDASANRAGLLAALLFTLMPVVVCMSHEGKPHLPGAVLMLIAVYLAMRSSAEPHARRHFAWMSVACGAAVGMVLSSWPICVLIPLVAFRAVGANPRTRITRFVAGSALAVAVYFVTNPYVLINAVTNREVLRSNFGNSLAMYEIARISEGFVRVISLTAEGATWPVVVLGMAGLVLTLRNRNRAAQLLLFVAALFFLQFVLIGAGKPAEYGRFGIFTDTALAIGTAFLLFTALPRYHRAVRFLWGSAAVFFAATFSCVYLVNFAADASGFGTRMQTSDGIQHWTEGVRRKGKQPTLVVLAEPAPYICPPLDFRKTEIVLAVSRESVPADRGSACRLLLQEPDLIAPGMRTVLGQLFDERPERRFRRARESPISWAGKPFHLETPDLVKSPSRGD